MRCVYAHASPLRVIESGSSPAGCGGGNTCLLPPCPASISRDVANSSTEKPDGADSHVGEKTWRHHEFSMYQLYSSRLRKSEEVHRHGSIALKQTMIKESYCQPRRLSCSAKDGGIAVNPVLAFNGAARKAVPPLAFPW